jgi:hypothetical protein
MTLEYKNPHIRRQYDARKSLNKDKTPRLGHLPAELNNYSGTEFVKHPHVTKTKT